MEYNDEGVLVRLSVPREEDNFDSMSDAKSEEDETDSQQEMDITADRKSDSCCRNNNAQLAATSSQEAACNSKSFQATP